MHEPINAALMTPEEKLQFILDQILQARVGDIDWMLCPYCGGENRDTNAVVCCMKFQKATIAILDRMDKQDAMDFMSNVADRQLDIATKKYIN